VTGVMIDETLVEGSSNGPSTTETRNVDAHRSRRRDRVLVLVLLWALASSFYIWTATSSGNPIVFHTPQGDYYNQLANGFLDGELSIPTVPPLSLLELRDPYNPVANGSYGLHDLSLYHGHLYLSWGPTPVVTLFIPWRVLGLGPLAANLAAFIYSAVGLAFALALLELLIARFLPLTRPLKIALGGLALATSSVVPYLLRRPSVYEDSISCSYCFVFGGLYFLALGLFSVKRRTLWLFVGSASLGLAVGARFETLIFGVLILAVAWLASRRSPGRTRARRTRRIIAVIVPWSACVLLVFAYNFARFGNPLQIGSAYQLAGYDPTKTPLYQMSYVAPGLYYYFFAPIRFTLAFPFIALPPPAFYPGGTPAVYAPEVAGGLLWTTPILVMLFGATWLLRRRLAELGHVVLMLSISAMALVFLISLGIFSVTMRYETDFASLLVVGAVLSWIAWRPSKRVARFAVNVVGSLMIFYGALVGVSLSVSGPSDQMQVSNIQGYQSLESKFTFIPDLITKIEGRARVVRVIDPDVIYPADLSDYGTYDVGSLRFTFLQDHEEIDIIAPDAGVYTLGSHVERTASAPEKGPVEIYIQVGKWISRSVLSYEQGLSVRVNLRAGLNRVYAWVTFAGKQPAGASADIVNVYGLTVRRLVSR